MAVSSKPSVTAVQVGEYAYFIHNNIPCKAKVLKTISEVTDINADNTAEEVINYFCEAFTEPIRSTRVYASESALKTAVDALIDALDP